jgi:hypothetical protein
VEKFFRKLYRWKGLTLSRKLTCCKKGLQAKENESEEAWGHTLNVLIGAPTWGMVGRVNAQLPRTWKKDPK